MPDAPTAAPAATADHFADRLTMLLADIWGWIAGHGFQILIGCLIAAIIVVALLALKAFGLRLCRNPQGRAQWPFVIGRALSKTRIWFMIAVAAQLVSAYADAPAAFAHTITFFFTIAIVLQVAVWARVLIIGLIEHRAGLDADNASLGSAMSIIRLLVTVAVFAIALVVILDNLGVNVTGLVAGLGIGGIAIGLAAQGIFSDLFAALSILFDKPFQRGDGIGFDQISGSVEKIGLKTTRLRSATGEMVVISNANLLNKELRNYNRLDHRRMIHKFGLIYQTRPEVLARVPAMASEIVKAEPACKFVRCGMTGLGASSLDFELQFDVFSPDYEEIFAANHRVLIAIIERFNAGGIEFAYPTQTTFTAAPDGRMVMPYPEAARPGRDADRQ
jgi:small-conductance mechanosensitive channel